MAERECLIKGIANAESYSGLFEVLDNADIVSGNIAKTCYGCGRCGLLVTVEYPDFGEAVETAGIYLGRGAASGCLSVSSAKDIAAIEDRFAATDPLDN